MTPSLRKLLLTAHITFSVGWLGSVAAFLALAIVGLTSRDAQMARAAYLAMEQCLLADPMLAADLDHRIPRLRLPQHPQNLLFAASSLRHLQALLSPSREPRQAAISQLHSGLVFGFWVTITESPKRSLRSGDLALAAGVSTDTLRHYERQEQTAASVGFALESVVVLLHLNISIAPSRHLATDRYRI
jgi:hypothetical protein